MKKSTTLCLFISLLLVALFNGRTSAQTTIYYQDFDSTYTTLPTGWTTTATLGGAPWAIDSTNSSYAFNETDGYNGASGLNSVEIANPTTGTIGSFAYSAVLYSCPISAVNYSDIVVGWGTRNTKHFEDDASAIQGFYVSTNGGSTWDSIPYLENQSNSDWFWDNNGNSNDGDAPNIYLDPSANHATLMFKWIVNLYYTASGTYRIDDFTVAGTYAPTAVNNIPNTPSALVYVAGNSTIDVVAKDIPGQKFTVELFDMLGNRLQQQEMTTGTLGMNVSNLANSVYLVKVSNGATSQVTKVALNR